MVKLIYSQSKPPGRIVLTHDNKLSGKAITNQPTEPLLRLVVSNPPSSPDQLKSSSNIRNSNVTTSFSAKVRVKGPWFYEMIIRDPSYYLKCDLILEVAAAQNVFEPGKVTCHFPTIQDSDLKAFVEEDEILYGMFMIQFQMKIMEQLLLFCGHYNISQLVIYADDEQAEDLGIYQDFLIHQDQTLTSEGEKTEMVIPTDPETFDDWVNFMEEANVKFVQELWREQRSNPVVQAYLRKHSLNR